MTLLKLAVKIFIIAFVVIGLLWLLMLGYVAWKSKQARTAFPPEGKFVTALGTEIHGLTFGDAANQAVVLIHGASGSTRDMTQGFAQELAERYFVVVIDRPGLGYSDRAPGYGGFWSAAGEPPQLQGPIIQAAALEFGAENPIVLGHSFGSAVALGWATEKPETLAGLVLVAGVSNPWPGGLGDFYKQTGSFLGGHIVVPFFAAMAGEKRINESIASIFAPQDPQPGYIENVGGRLSAQISTMSANAQQVLNLRPEVVKMVPKYADITVPVEIIHGDTDNIVPLPIHSEKLVDQVQNGRLTVLPGIGHMPHHTTPDVVIAAIDRIAEQID